MIKTKIEIMEKEFVDDVICDSCGSSCKKEHGTFEYMTLNANWGFYSDKDLESYEAQICEKCVDEKLSFIKFLKENTLFKSRRK